MVNICSKGLIDESNIKIISQAGRELLLCQSSDWSFILKAGTTTELARERINLHLKRFWMLINTIKDNKIINQKTLKGIEKRGLYISFNFSNRLEKENLTFLFY